MKKALLIALCGLTVMFSACKKTVDYAPNYVGSYLGQITLTITSMNNQPQTSLTFPMDGVGMDITNGSEANAVTATMTADNETHQTTGTTSAEKVDFDAIRLVIDKPDQNYAFSLDLKMEGTKNESDTLNLVGSFTGSGSANFMGQEQVFNEVSGTLTGEFVKQ